MRIRNSKAKGWRKALTNLLELSHSHFTLSSSETPKHKHKERKQDVAESVEPERGGAEQIGGTSHEHQRRQGLAGRPQVQPRPQRHHQNVFIFLSLTHTHFLSDFLTLVVVVVVAGLLEELAI